MKRICDASASRLCFRKGGCFSGFQFPFSFRQFIRRGIEAVITGLTRNQFGRKPTWVRIPPSPPITGASPFGGAPVIGGDDRSGRIHGLSAAERRKVSFHAIRYGFPLLFVGREMAGSPRLRGRRLPLFDHFAVPYFSSYALMLLAMTSRATTCPSVLKT